MKKLFQINTTVNSASTGRIAEEIGVLAMLQGWESYIAHGIRFSRPSKSKTIQIDNIYEVYAHVLQTRLFDRHGLASKNATRKLVEKIEQVDPDLIHLHNLHGYYLNIEILFNFLALKSIPIVWTLHDCWSFTGHCVHFDNIGCDKWKTLCSDCPQKKEYPSSLFADRSVENYNLKKNLFNSLQNLTLVPVSNWLGDLLSQSFFNKIPYRVIHNGQDLTVFNRKSTNRITNKYGLDNAFIILGVANKWSEQKGFNDFLELNKKLSSNEKIVLVGLNEKQLKVLPKNIIGIKRTESMEELCEFYSVADVFVNPTYEDSFGMVNIEALACGTPVVTYNSGGTSETISKETGFLVDRGNVQGLLNCILRVKKLKKEHFAEACRKRVEKLFDKNFKYQEYLGLYNELTNQ